MTEVVGVPSAPLVSICCITYNHERFIRDAIEGFLMQETPFPVEILIHDDASTDGTAEIVRTYENAHPDRIRGIYQVENQYAKGVIPSHFVFAQARGEYIALCEGDDYWTDPLKLARQVAAMARCPGIRMSFHAARRMDYVQNGKETTIGIYAAKDEIVPIEDVIARRHGMIPTASCMLTHEALQDVMRFMSVRPYLPVGDIYIQIISSLPRGALFINEVMSVYRYLAPGSWTFAGKADRRSILAHTRARVRSMVELDEATGFSYSATFAAVNRKWLVRALRKSDVFLAGERLAFYNEFRRSLRLLDRISLYPRLLVANAFQRLSRRNLLPPPE